MFEYDICRCGNADDCPYKDKCKRAMKMPPGIYSYSSFYSEGKDCEYFYPMKEEVIEDVK